MHIDTPRRFRRILLPATALIAAGILLGGCSGGSSADAGSADAAAAVPDTVVQQLDQYTGPVAAEYDGEPFDVSSLKGKTVWWVTFFSGNPFLATVGANFETALESVGVNVVPCDGKGNPVDVNNCITQAVSQGADAIQVDGPPAETYANSLAAAIGAGIPVLSGGAVDASGKLAAGLAGQSSQPFKLTGELAADWIVKDSGGKASVLFIAVPDVPGSVEEQEAFSSRLAETCPGCEVTVEGTTLANWATDLATTTNAAILKDPNITYVVPAFDPMTQFVGPAIQQAGKASSIKIVTVNGSLQQMQDLKNKNIVAAEIGIDLNALGYVEADQVLRAMTDTPTVDVAYAPVRIFDGSNIDELELTADSSTDGSLYGDGAPYSAIFDEIWTNRG